MLHSLNDREGLVALALSILNKVIFKSFQDQTVLPSPAIQQNPFYDGTTGRPAQILIRRSDCYTLFCNDLLTQLHEMLRVPFQGA